MIHPDTRPIGLVARHTDGRDDDGNQTYSETVTVAPGLFAPSGGSESTDEQDQAVMQPTVYLIPAATLASIDAVIPDITLDDDGHPVTDEDGQVVGTRYEVEGDPEQWGVGTAVRLKRVTG